MLRENPDRKNAAVHPRVDVPVARKWGVGNPPGPLSPGFPVDGKDGVYRKPGIGMLFDVPPLGYPAKIYVSLR